MGIAGHIINQILNNKHCETQIENYRGKQVTVLLSTSTSRKTFLRAEKLAIDRVKGTGEVKLLVNGWRAQRGAGGGGGCNSHSTIKGKCRGAAWVQTVDRLMDGKAGPQD